MKNISTLAMSLDTNPMLLNIGAEAGATVFQVTGFAQKKYKGIHFCSLSARLIGPGYLCFEVCEYRAPLRDDEIPDRIPLLSTVDEPPCVYEHFLQSVRKKFAISHDLIRIVSTWNYQHLWDVRNLRG